MLDRILIARVEDPILANLFALGLKATALLALVFVVHFVLGRRRVLLRSVLGNAGLLALLLLPASMLTLPRVGLPVLGTQTAARPVPGFASTGQALTDRQKLMVPGSPAPRSPEIATVRPIHPDRQASTGQLAVVTVAPLGDEVGRRAAPLGTVLLAIYLAGLLMLAIRLGRSLGAVQRLRARSVAVTDGRWLDPLAGWRDHLGLRRDVALRQSHRLGVPVAVGTLRPAVLLPAGLVVGAAPGVVDAVLLHELAHIRRADYGWNLIRAVVQVLYWPHPLVWLLGRWLGATREQACDDLCVHWLGGAARYRAALIEVAAELGQRPGVMVGMAMARPSRLGRRLAWIDRSPGRPTCVPRPPVRFAWLGAVLALAGGGGALELTRAEPPAPPGLPTIQVPAPPPPAVKAIEVVVLAHDTRRPLAGATVQFVIDHGSINRHADDAGRVRLDLTGRRYEDEVLIEVWAPNYVQQRFTFSENNPRHPRPPASVTAQLWPGEETLGGKVVDSAGRPIRGVKVGISGQLGSKNDPHEMAYLPDLPDAAFTDARGEWRSRSFRATKEVYLYLSHPDFLSDNVMSARTYGRDTSAGQPTRNDRPLAALRDFSDVQVMAHGVDLVGTVRDQQGRPVAGAEVGWMAASPYYPLYYSIPTTRVDAEGRFRLNQVAPGPVTVQVTATGHAPELQSVDARPDPPPLVITLQPPRTLAGRVVDTQGRPLADAQVMVWKWRGVRTTLVDLRTDAAGQFRWDEAPADAVELYVNHSGFSSVDLADAISGPDPLVVTLRRSFTILGQVRDAETGQPVAPIRVQYSNQFNKYTGKPVWLGGHGADEGGGRYSIDVDAEGLPNYRIRVEADGYQTYESPDLPSGGGAARLDVKLRRLDRPESHQVAGTVRRPDGTPLAGADVALTYSDDKLASCLTVLNGRIERWNKPVVVATDAAGRFTLERDFKPVGRIYAVVAVHPDYFGVVDHSAFEADPTVQVQRWGRVVGLARVDGQPAPNVQVVAWRDEPGFDDFRLNVRNLAMTDAAGRFAMDHVPPEDVRIFGEPRADEANTMAPNQAPLRWNNGTLVVVAPGATTEANLNGGGRPVVARIAWPAGFAPTAEDLGWWRVTIERDGFAELPWPAEFVARRDGSAFAWGQRWWDSPAGLDFRHQQFTAEVRVAPDGSVRINDVPAGSYHLELRAEVAPQDGTDATRRRAVRASRAFFVPASPGGPVDLGIVPAELEPPATPVRSGPVPRVVPPPPARTERG